MAHRTVKNELPGRSCMSVFYMEPTPGLPHGTRMELAELLPGQAFDVPDQLDYLPVYLDIPANMVCEVRVGPKTPLNRAANYDEPTGSWRGVTVRNDFSFGVYVRVLYVQAGRWNHDTWQMAGGGLVELANINACGRWEEPEDLGWPNLFIELHSHLIAEAVVAAKVGWGREA